jgi:hypothetical protein
MPIRSDLGARPASSLTRRASRRADESGAVLILALVFMVAGAMIVLALASAASNDLTNTTHFASARAQTYAAGGATNVSISDVRSNYTATPLGSANALACPFTPGAIAIGSGTSAVNVWCDTPVPTPAQPASGPGVNRWVEFWACPTSIASGPACATSFTIHAVVGYNDDYNGVSVPPGTVIPTCKGLSTDSTCGTAMYLASWVVR